MEKLTVSVIKWWTKRSPENINVVGALFEKLYISSIQLYLLLLSRTSPKLVVSSQCEQYSTCYVPLSVVIIEITIHPLFKIGALVQIFYFISAILSADRPAVCSWRLLRSFKILECARNQVSGASPRETSRWGWSFSIPQSVARSCLKVPSFR